jgi:hypothetical protein
LLRSLGRTLRHEDGVDDVDDAVGLEDIRGGDGGHAALGVGEHDLVAHHGDGEVFTLDGLEGGLAAKVASVKLQMHKDAQLLSLRALLRGQKHDSQRPSDAWMTYKPIQQPFAEAEERKFWDEYKREDG